MTQQDTAAFEACFLELLERLYALSTIAPRPGTRSTIESAASSKPDCCWRSLPQSGSRH